MSAQLHTPSHSQNQQTPSGVLKVGSGDHQGSTPRVISTGKKRKEKDKQF